jgi:hypothetical protein
MGKGCVQQFDPLRVDVLPILVLGWGALVKTVRWRGNAEETCELKGVARNLVDCFDVCSCICFDSDRSFRVVLIDGETTNATHNIEPSNGQLVAREEPGGGLDAAAERPRGWGNKEPRRPGKAAMAALRSIS